MRVIEHEVSLSEEKRIVTGLIVSTQICKDILPHTNIEYFTNDYLRRVVSWCHAFYEEFKKAPVMHIRDIFEQEKPHMRETEAELIEILLENLSNSYTGDDINVDYILQCAEQYYISRELEIHINNISTLKEDGDIEGAEAELARYHKVSIKLEENIYINPGDIETRERIYKKRDEQQISFFKFPGDLGEYLGNHKPGDVVGITAPQKRGKSFLLGAYNKHLIAQKIHTLKWSIEMTDTEELERFDKFFFPMVNGEEGYYPCPVFDCMQNQIANCGMRESEIQVRDDAQSELDPHPDHVPCTKCRNDPENWKLFIPTVYRKEMYRNDNTIHTIRKNIKRYQNRISKYSRLVVRPKYSLTYDLMMRDLDHLESRHGFIPKALLIDYVDILDISSKFDDYRLEDEKWKLMQKLAGQTKCLVVTPTQSNKEGAKSGIIHGTDQSGFYGKSRHVNMMMAINQTPEEKAIGLWRCGITDARSQHQNQDDVCLVIQDLKAGQMYIDSHWPGKFYNRKIR